MLFKTIVYIAHCSEVGRMRGEELKTFVESTAHCIVVWRVRGEEPKTFVESTAPRTVVWRVRGAPWSDPGEASLALWVTLQQVRPAHVHSTNII